MKRRNGDGGDVKHGGHRYKDEAEGMILEYSRGSCRWMKLSGHGNSSSEQCRPVTFVIEFGRLGCYNRAPTIPQELRAKILPWSPASFLIFSFSISLPRRSHRFPRYLYTPIFFEAPWTPPKKLSIQLVFVPQCFFPFAPRYKKQPR